MSRDFLHLGGLAQIISLPGGSKTRSALSLLGALFDSPPPSSPSIPDEGDGYYLFLSDEGFLYPEVLCRQMPHALSRLLLVKAATSDDVWKAGLEAVQTGLFSWIFLRPSKPCHATHLRKLQLSAERTRARVLLLCQIKLPHWTLTTTLEVDGRIDANTLLTKLSHRHLNGIHRVPGGSSHLSEPEAFVH